MKGDWIDSNTAAEFLGITRHYLVELARDGRIRAVRRSGRVSDNKSRQWFFDRVDLERFKRDPRPAPAGEREFITVGEAASMMGRTFDTMRLYRDRGFLEWIEPGQVPKEQRVFRARVYVRKAQVLAMMNGEKPGWGWSVRPEPEPLQVPREDCIWLAGFFDGEGCVSISHRKGSWILRIGIACSAIETLREIQAIFGGNFTLRARQQAHYLDQASWNAHCDLAMSVLEAIRPWMRVKRQQAEIGIELQRRVRQRHHAKWFPVPPEEQEWREQMRLKLVELNRPHRHLKP